MAEDQPAPLNKTIHSSIVKCSHCKQILSIDDFDSHKCKWVLQDVKQIPVAYFRDDSFDETRVMTGYGLDGVLYSFVVTPRVPIPYMKGLSDENLHKQQTDEDLTEPLSLRLIRFN